ncbi:MAG: hypothetical protein JST40_01555 [Armatimonadetes bacterium]|nr:hypothetical protein [Armatimonadota bacterium]
MPFEPLQTDEKLDAPIKAEPDFDQVMLKGCSFFVVASLMSYFLAIWPWIAVKSPEKLGGFFLAVGLGFGTSGIFGAYCAHKSGLPGASGYLGGGLASAVFLHLRLKSLALGYDMREIPKPEFPLDWVWMAPVVWVLATLLVAAVFLLKSPDGPSFEPEKRQ